MREDEILERMRDIQLPDVPGAGASLEFAVWPFVVLGALVGLILLTRIVSRSRWRRAARGELARILAVEDGKAQWAMLLKFSTSLSGRAGRSLALPEIAFRRPEAIGEAERAEFVAFLRAELRR